MHPAWGSAARCDAQLQPALRNHLSHVRLSVLVLRVASTRACVQAGNPLCFRPTLRAGCTNAANGDASHPCVGGVAPRAAPRVVGADCAGLNLGRSALDALGLDALGIDEQLVFFPPSKARAKHYFDMNSNQASHDIMERED